MPFLIKSISSKQPNLNFWNWLSPNNCNFIPFVGTNSHLTKPYKFDIKCHVGGGQNFLFTFRGFKNKREYSGADWMYPLVLKMCR